MTFKPYDILANLLPGFLLLVFYFYITGGSYDKDMTVPYTAISFLLGYLMNLLASWLEDGYYFTWGGKPSNMLLSGKGVWQVKFYQSAEVKILLSMETQNTAPSNDELFAIAMRHANTQKDSRVDDLNAKFAFSRTLLTSALVCTIIVLVKHYSEPEYYCVIPLLIALWFKTKQYGYYYAKEVLNIYMVEVKKRP